MASAFRSFLSASTRLRAVAPRFNNASANFAPRASNLATIAPGRIIFRSKHIDYTQKYADKLSRRAREEGVETIEALKAKVLPPTQSAFKKAQPIETENKESASSSQKQKQPAAAAAASSSSAAPAGAPSSGSPALDKIMKMDLIKELDAEEISKIWVQKHLDQENSISAVVPADTYKKMLKRSKEHPIIVLMHGVVSENPKVLTVDQAQILTFGLQQYYVSDHPEKLQLLKDFHKQPEKFSHEKLIELTEISG
ncbi:ATP synthase mitochondrial F1 complex assembly factor 1 [Linnemannia zychae]|nr:ATP synthase mitochondrial F1 complex assembly factor 1 [Linnemannia zychae]